MGRHRLVILEMTFMKHWGTILNFVLFAFICLIICIAVWMLSGDIQIEQRVNDVWTILHIKPRKDGAVYAFNDIGYELAPHSTRLFTIHVEPDKYDFERGLEYRIAKEFFKKGKKVPQNVYCYFSFE